MSPASSGSLEVERYIGACLISSHSRSKNSSPVTGGNAIKNCPNRDVFYPRDPFVHDVYSGSYVPYRSRRCNSVDGWAGGMPLISFANSQRRNRRPDTVEVTRCASPRISDDVPHNTPLSRLAVHTQGLPLILSGRHGNRRSKASRNGAVQGRGVLDSTKKIGECKDNTINGVDSLSVASDESSSSNNSETSLPRIIKPRKRRKKDRKPHTIRNTQVTPDSERPDVCIGSSNIVTLKPYIPYCFERYSKERVHPLEDNSVYVGDRIVRNSVASDTSANDTKKTCNDLSSETPQLHHRFEDVFGGLDADVDSGEPSSCQCRYCDPAGQIWDVDRHCYSPFLTTPTFRHLHQSFTDTSIDLTTTVPKKQHQFSERISYALQNQCLISTFSVDVKDVPVQNCKDTEVGRSLPNRTQQCLEISTKIVTSPNGHRDLEIRLFSSFPIDDDRPIKNKEISASLSHNKTDAPLKSKEFDQTLTPEE